MNGLQGHESVSGTVPRQWSFAQLEYWVNQVDHRDVVPDEVWVGVTRRCVVYLSELVWKRNDPSNCHLHQRQEGETLLSYCARRRPRGGCG